MAGVFDRQVGDDAEMGIRAAAADQQGATSTEPPLPETGACEDGQKPERHLAVTWMGKIGVKVASAVTTVMLSLNLLLVIVEGASNHYVDVVGQLFCGIGLAGALVSPPPLAGLTAFVLGLLGISLRVPIFDTELGVAGLVVCSILLLMGIITLALHGYTNGSRRLSRWEGWQVGEIVWLSCCLPQAAESPQYWWCQPACVVAEKSFRCSDFFVFRVFRGLLQWLHKLFLLLCFVLAVFMLSTLTPSGVAEYAAELVLPSAAEAAGRVPPLEVGTPQNINMSGYPQDFTGIWWLRYFRNPGPLYRESHLEEIVSFAGMTIETPHPNLKYNMTALVPAALTRHWGYSNSLMGRVALIANARTNPTKMMSYVFQSENYVYMPGGNQKFFGVQLSEKWMMFKLTDDQWLRYIYNGPDRGDHEYVLTRIVYADGSPAPAFDAWVKHMGVTKLRVWATNSQRCRKCGVLPFSTPRNCAQQCKHEA